MDKKQFLIEKVKGILLSHGIKIDLSGCGCCGSPWFKMLYNERLIIDENQCNFDMIEESATEAEDKYFKYYVFYKPAPGQSFIFGTHTSSQQKADGEVLDKVMSRDDGDLANYEIYTQML